MRTTASAMAGLLLTVAGGAPAAEPTGPSGAGTVMEFQATAYSDTGRTDAGSHTRPGVVAADPNVLPLGSLIHIRRAGQYSGRYIVKDSGRKINGREVDIFIPRRREAKRFGKRPVSVEVIRYGDNRKDPESKQAD